MSRCKIFIALLAAFTVAIWAMGRQHVSADDDRLKVGFVYVGPTDDMGWSHAHEESRQHLIRRYPSVETMVAAMVSMLEPVMVITLGVIVGFIVLAIFMPLPELINSMQK